MNRRLRRVAISSMSAAILLGFAGAEAEAAQASTQTATPHLTAFTLLLQNDPPGPCTSEEIGQSKVGPDGNTYTCLPEGTNPEA